MCSRRWCAGGRRGGVSRRAVSAVGGNAAARRASRPGTRGSDTGRGGGRLNPLHGPVHPAPPPPHAANRPGQRQNRLFIQSQDFGLNGPRERCARRVAPQPQIWRFFAAISEYDGRIGRVRRGIRQKCGGYGRLAGQTMRWRTSNGPKRRPGSALRTGAAFSRRSRRIRRDRACAPGNTAKKWRLAGGWPFWLRAG
jgi:hypothetical protein